MKKYDPKAIENKWQKEWIKNKIYKTSEKKGKKSCYVLDMFPYPSGEGLHVGHPKGYIATDIYSRYKKLLDYNILHPMGFDAFGLPAENYAIKNKIHPEVAVKKNIKRFKEQLSKIGFNYDWGREFSTTDPKYYKWTQWIFLQMYKKGLAYESNEPINWCPSCKTGLANEDLEDGKCERCGSVIEKKPLRQWVLRITDYADRMLEDLSLLPKWPETIKLQQENWIGKSEGMIFTSPVKDTNFKIQTFSAHFEAFAADTFVVIAPDHPFLKELVAGVQNEKEILDFADALVKERLISGYTYKEPKGIFTGRYTVDPIGNGELPIWVANYALSDYGTGIVKCSCHDERDFAFAKKYNLKLKPVLFPEDVELKEKVEKLEICFTDMKNGILLEPKEFNNKKARDARNEIIAYLEKNNLAQRKNSYRLRDWVFSRQRYWGEPIPLIHCEKCGVVPVPEKDLPVKLPKVKNYEPTGTGESPLAGISKWVNTKCPECFGKAKRETNTMPQWAGSSWYYLRFIDPKNEKALVDPKKEKSFMPVSLYVGGAEHATRHLIYARFWHKFLYDQKIVSTPEPFERLYSVGLIAGPDGRKMSKRYGNIVNPDDVINLYGADTLRVYEMFMGPFEQGIAWSTDNMIGSRRFLERVWGMQEFVSKENEDKTLTALLHKTIKKVGEDIESFSFNTAISAMMIFVNLCSEQKKITKSSLEKFLIILSPFAPHITEEIWHSLSHKTSVYKEKWPEFDPKLLVSDSVTIIIQINGKVRAQIEIPADLDEEKMMERALKEPKILENIGGKEIKRSIVVKGKLVNFVV